MRALLYLAGTMLLFSRLAYAPPPPEDFGLAATPGVVVEQIRAGATPSLTKERLLTGVGRLFNADPTNAEYWMVAVHALSDPDPNIRRVASALLGVVIRPVGNRDIMAEVEARLKSVDIPTRLAAIRVMLFLNPRSGQANVALTELIGSNTEAERLEAIAVATETSPRHPNTERALILQLRSPGRTGVNARLALWMGRTSDLQDSAQLLLALDIADNSQTRISAIAFLGNLTAPTKAVGERLRGIVNDKTTAVPVRIEAVTALGKLMAVHHTDDWEFEALALGRACDSYYETEVDVRRAAIQAVSRIPRFFASFRDGLRRAVRDPNLPTAKRAARELGRRGPIGLAEVISQASNDQVRADAALALLEPSRRADVTAQDDVHLLLRRTLTEVTYHKNQASVRKAAAKALGEMKPEKADIELVLKVLSEMETPKNRVDSEILTHLRVALKNYQRSNATLFEQVFDPFVRALSGKLPDKAAALGLRNLGIKLPDAVERAVVAVEPRREPTPAPPLVRGTTAELANLAANLDEDPETRADAVTALARVATSDAHRRVIADALTDSSEAVRLAAARAIGDRGKSETLYRALTIVLLQESSPAVRIEIAKAIGKMKPNSDADSDQRLLEALRKDTDDKVRIEILAALSTMKRKTIPNTVETLAELLATGSVETRRAAISTITTLYGGVASRSARPITVALLRLLGHADPEVRAAASQSLGALTLDSALRLELEVVRPTLASQPLDLGSCERLVGIATPTR